MSPERDTPWAIRAIEPRDDATVAAIVRDTLGEFTCVGDGFASSDAELAAMTAAYRRPGHVFLVVELDGRVLGGGGFGPLAGADPDARLAELRKMYFRPALRGRGAGRALLVELLGRMRQAGYRRCYLETTRQMHVAQTLYRSLGFAEIDGPLGATGHHGCDRFYVLDL